MKRRMLVFVLCACEPVYGSVPLTSATVAPRGDVTLVSYGIVDIAPRGSEGEALRGLHLRATLINDGHREWTFDTRDQRVSLDGYGTSAPAFASASSGTP